MVVTIIQPVSGGPFGPGFIVQLDSDFIGPLPSDARWDVLLTTESGGGFLWQTRSQPTSTNAKSWTYGSEADYNQPFFPVELEAMHGDTLELKARLRSPTTIFDEGTVLITLDLTTGAPYILREVMRQQSTAQVDNTATLEQIEQAVHMSFPGLNNIPIGEFLGIPLAGGAERLLITPDRTGEGTLDRPIGLVDVAAVGLEWEVVSAPPGVGVVQGAPDRWARRVLDLQLVGTDASSNEYTRTFESFHVDHYRYMFQGFGLTRLYYWIEPGITVRFYWLVFGL